MDEILSDSAPVIITAAKLGAYSPFQSVAAPNGLNGGNMNFYKFENCVKGSVPPQQVTFKFMGQRTTIENIKYPSDRLFDIQARSSGLLEVLNEEQWKRLVTCCVYAGVRKIAVLFCNVMVQVEIDAKFTILSSRGRRHTIQSSTIIYERSNVGSFRLLLLLLFSGQQEVKNDVLFRDNVQQFLASQKKPQYHHFESPLAAKVNPTRDPYLSSDGQVKKSFDRRFGPLWADKSDTAIMSLDAARLQTPVLINLSQFAPRLALDRPVISLDVDASILGALPVGNVANKLKGIDLDSTVVMKIRDPVWHKLCHDRAGASFHDIEAQFSKATKILWNELTLLCLVQHLDVTPRALGYGTLQDASLATAESAMPRFCGPFMLMEKFEVESCRRLEKMSEEELGNLFYSQVQDAFEKLHQAEVVYGSIEFQSFAVDEDGKLKLVNFEKARHCREVGEYKREMGLVRKLFGVE